MKKLLSILLAGIIMVAGMTACSDKESQQEAQSGDAAVQFTDFRGNEITLDEYPERIVSLSPTSTEIMYAIGAQDKLVGVTNSCDYPAEALEKEKVGDFSGPNLEMIVNLKPDVVVGGTYIQEDVTQALSELGIPVISTEAENIEDIFKSIEILGMLSQNEENAQDVIADMETKLAEIAEKVKDSEPVSVFYVVWKDPFKTAGNNTFINEVITLAGGENVASDVEGWADYSREELIVKNPYAIVSSSHSSAEKETEESLAADPLFSDLEASKAKRIHIMSDDSIIARGGPRIVDAIEEIRVALESWK